MAHSSRWSRLLPVAFITYSLAYLDRANFGFGAAGGMADDLHITPGTSSLLGSLFFLGYFFFQIPGAHYATHQSARKLIFWSLIAWGALAAATGLISDVRMLMGVRFMLGVVESAVFPGMLILLSRWFTRQERSRANTIMVLGNAVTVLWMSIVSGYLVQAVGWRGMFVWEGVPAILWAFVWWKLVEDHPADANWLSDVEKKELNETLYREQEGIRPIRNYATAFRSKVVIGLCLIYFCWSFGVYGFVIWLPSIIKSAPGTSMVATGWLSSVPYCVAVATMLVGSWFSDSTLHRRAFIWPFLLVGSLAFYGSYWIGAGHFWVSFVLLCVAAGGMYAPYGPFFAMITEVLPRNVAGVAIALINSFGALGAFAGSYAVGYLNGAAGFGMSYLTMSIALLVAGVLSLVQRFNSIIR